MRSRIEKWGNSAAVRIPTAVLEAAHLHLNQPVDMRVEGGRIVIAPPDLPRYDLDALVAGITDENRPEPVSGPIPGPQGGAKYP